MISLKEPLTQKMDHLVLCVGYGGSGPEVLSDYLCGPQSVSSSFLAYPYVDELKAFVVYEHITDVSQSFSVSRLLIEAATTVKIVVVVAFDALLKDRGRAVHATIRWVQDLAPEAIKSGAGLLIGVSGIPILDNKSKIKGEFSQIKVFIQQNFPLISIPKENIFAYSPLNQTLIYRGQLDREGVMHLIKGVSPIYSKGENQTIEAYFYSRFKGVDSAAAGVQLALDLSCFPSVVWKEILGQLYGVQGLCEIEYARLIEVRFATQIYDLLQRLKKASLKIESSLIQSEESLEANRSRLLAPLFLRLDQCKESCQDLIALGEMIDCTKNVLGCMTVFDAKEAIAREQTSVITLSSLEDEFNRIVQITKREKDLLSEQLNRKKELVTSQALINKAQISISAQQLLQNGLHSLQVERTALKIANDEVNNSLNLVRNQIQKKI